MAADTDKFMRTILYQAWTIEDREELITALEALAGEENALAVRGSIKKLEESRKKKLER